jgi:putative intracellular protease/amidase
VARVFFPLPDRDFDTTEVAVPWRLLTDAGHQVVFGTESGAVPACDPLLLTGVVFGQLGADPEPVAFYRQMERDPAFLAPLRWEAGTPDAFDALWLAGGHAPGMRQYLGSAPLQELVAAWFRSNKPIGAICHGVLVAARAREPSTGKSPLHGRKTSCLPKYMERSAYLATFWLRGSYYRTYPDYVEDEVKTALASPDDFVLGPRTLFTRWTATSDAGAFVVEDQNYVSARWPGDAYKLARALISRL